MHAIGNTLRIGNRQRNAQPLPITAKSMSYRIGNGISEKSLPIECKLLILKQSAIGNFAYKERTLADWVLFLSFGGEKQGSLLGLLSAGDGDALDRD